MPSSDVQTDPEQQLHCPLCEYDLRGLVEPRCPECGYSFNWDELRDPARRLHPYLFEHHPERNVWSFRKTLANSMLPRRFWRTLYPTQPSFPRRLMLYGLLVALIAAGALLGAIAYRSYQVDQTMRGRRATQMRFMNPQTQAEIIVRHGSVQAYLDLTSPTFPSWRYFSPLFISNWLDLGGHLQVTAFALLWPWMTFASLLVFRASMRRARVRPVHVLRCVIYSADLAAVAAAIVTIGWLFCDPWLHRTRNWSEFWWRFSSAQGALWVIAVLFALLTFRLWIAYRRYLRFDHPLATAIASQIMIGLLTLKFAADFYVSTRYGGW
jgi:hypothetical protein